MTLRTVRVAPDPTSAPEDPRTLPELTWRALDGDEVAGDVSVWLRPDGRCHLFFDLWRPDAYGALTDAVTRDMRCDLYVTLDDAEFDALEACIAAGFAVNRRESYYRIPVDPSVTALASAAMPDGLDVISAADADVSRLRILDDALRQDVPGSDGWRWDEPAFVAETFSADFDPATYLVAVARATGEYAGLVRIWMSRVGPRLGLIGILVPYRRRGAARALLGRALRVLSERGHPSVIAEADDTNIPSVSLLTAIGARRYGGSVELRWRQPAIGISD